MREPIIYCKSFIGDLERAGALCRSIARFNRDDLPFFISVPRGDLPAFEKALASLPVRLVADEEIFDCAVAAWGPATRKDLDSLPDHLRQQAIKCEFWRWAGCDTYIIIDSDSYFIRPFGRSDFIYDENIPYTVMHEAKDVLQFAARSGMDRVLGDYHALRQHFADLFGRKGRHWDFGPTPVVWSSRIWQLLANDWAAMRSTNTFAMIRENPCELLWYGESLLHFRPFAVMPIEPLFKVYHFRQQYEEGRRLGENDRVLAANFLGVVKQSNWNRPPAKSWWNRQLPRIFRSRP